MENSILVKILDLIDSGYWKSVQWKVWADAVITKLDDPPYWTIQLSLAMSAGEAISILRERLAEVNYKDSVNHKSIVLGYMFLRFKEREVDLKEFLSMAWQETEGSEDVGTPSNADIHNMYESYIRILKSRKSFESLVERVSGSFFENAQAAEKALAEVKRYSSLIT